MAQVAFTPTTASAQALRLANALADSPSPRLLLLCGPPGVGKSALLRATVLRFRKRRPAAAIPTWRHRITGPLRTLPWTAPSILPILLRDVLRSGPIRMARATAQVLRKDWRHKLPAITAPTLVVWGEHDRVCNPRIGQQIAASGIRTPWSKIRQKRAGKSCRWRRSSRVE